MEHEIPFSQLIDLAGVDESSYCDVDIDIGELSFDAEEDADGELRRLKGEVGLQIHAECFERKEIELIEDAYSPSCRMSLDKEQLLMEELAAENKGQITLKEVVNIGAEAPNISEVFNVLGKLSLSESNIVDDRVILEGVVGCNILYLAGNEEQPIYCSDCEIPFRHSAEVKGVKNGMGLDIEMNLENSSYSMISAKEVEVRFVISLNTRVTNQISVPVIARVNELPPDDRRLEVQPSITIYFTQPGDTLWKIAKKYYTTIDELKRDNDFGGSDTPVPGEQILIPRKL
jgi:hypothetical protein